MQILSAVDAISPAFARTKLVLFTPFRKGRTWKLSATSYLSFAGTIFIPFPLIYCAAFLLVPGATPAFKIFWIGLGVFLTLLYVLVFALCGRLQFAFFDMVLNHGELVAPAWRKYGPQSRRWTGVKMLTGTLFTLVMAVPAFAVFRRIATSFPAMLESLRASQHTQQPPTEFFNLMAAFYGAYFLLMLAVWGYSLMISTISAFVVPSMALENTPVMDAFRRFAGFVRRETGQFFAYIGIRIGLGMVGYFGLVLVYEIALFFVLAVVALICALIGLLLHLAGVPNAVLFGLGLVTFFIVMFALNIYLLALVLGPFFTFFEAHTLYFLGGRYPLLGDLLERSTPPPRLQPPPGPPIAPWDPSLYTPPPQV